MPDACAASMGRTEAEREGMHRDVGGAEVGERGKGGQWATMQASTWEVTTPPHAMDAGASNRCSLQTPLVRTS